ncbi:MAG: DUF1045 domain-containing protein [Alphaproteobacteria bacterium]|nr:DUF1045 domain-containing protein [Alphaproteobacteria bacterium]
MSDYARYAVYYAPPAGSDLARFGAEWLGRDAQTESPCGPPAGIGLSAERLAALTAAPARYGFHGTLKPPFALAAGTDRVALEKALAALAADLAPAAAPEGLRLTEIGHFLALTPAPDDRAIRPLAAAVVARLDRFRAPPSEGELARRRAAGLSARQEALLRRWGYPYVMEEFRFHLTLTGPLEPADLAAAAAALGPLVAPFARAPFRIEAFSLFGDPGGGAPFRLLRRFPLGA